MVHIEIRQIKDGMFEQYSRIVDLVGLDYARTKSFEQLYVVSTFTLKKDKTNLLSILKVTGKTW